MDERRLDVEHVDHHRHDRHDARVHGGGGPRRPAAFRAAGDDEARDLDAPPSGDATNAVTASIARTALLVIGSRAGHFSSPVRRNLSQV